MPATRCTSQASLIQKAQGERSGPQMCSALTCITHIADSVGASRRDCDRILCTSLNKKRSLFCIYILLHFSTYGASSLCWPRLHFDLPNQILRFRPPNKGIDRSAPQTPSKNAIKNICKKGTFFWRHQHVLHPMAEYSSTPKGVLEYP